ncbi:hypothetical protein PR202_gb23679 [Eleusine coracana subsp. coracana]|uniref:Uncharacterized protein n=1 Tax=Eleusine coracana subsp. coracana TaxID=191504 RepID=A0AAV5FK15_ELECO|nr:hypothetical protein PR202_gb23679 [Eleusine coracana subsp. coracana]
MQHQFSSFEVTAKINTCRKVKNKQGSNLVKRLEPAEVRSAEAALWVPHPRTGIYYPKGFEWVMEDVPSGAASFRQSYWLRTGETESETLPR